MDPVEISISRGDSATMGLESLIDYLYSAL